MIWVKTANVQYLSKASESIYTKFSQTPFPLFLSHFHTHTNPVHIL